VEKARLAELPDVLSPREIARVLGVGYAKALHIVKHGGIVHIQAGSHYLVSKVRFMEWLHSDKTRIIEVE